MTLKLPTETFKFFLIRMNDVKKPLVSLLIKPDKRGFVQDPIPF